MTSPNTSSPPAEYASSSNDTTTSPSLGSSSSSSSLSSSSSSSVASSSSSSSVAASAKASLIGAISSVRSGANIVKGTVESVLPKLSLAHASEGEEVAELMMQIQQQEKRTTAEVNEFRKVIREKDDIIEEREKEIDRLSMENKRLFRESYEWKEKCSTDSKRIDQLETQLALANTNLLQSQSMIMQREREIMDLQNKLIDMAQRNISSSLTSTVSPHPMSHPPRQQPNDDTNGNTTGNHTYAPTSNITSSSLRAEDLVAMAEEHDLRQIYASCGLTYPPTNCKPATAPKPEDGQTLDDIYANLDDGRGVVVIQPPMTYEAALAHHRDEVEKARSEGRPEPTPPTVRPPRHGPEWVKGMLAMVISSGYKVAPPDYPVLAAYTTIPSIGLALIPGDD